MSCGNPHEMPCSEVLEVVYSYLDQEVLDGEQRHRVAEHLDECAPCLREYGLEEAVKALVKRSCIETPPEGLRQKVLLRITEVRAEIIQGQTTA